MGGPAHDAVGGGMEQVLPAGDRKLGDAESLALIVGRELERRWPPGTGRLESICYYALVPTGKLFRPTLLLDAALAVGGTLESVLPAAVGAECGHVASLIHDDIIDQDELRRGRPSVHHRFGADDAIVVGDALIFELFASLAECRRTGVTDERVVSALESIARAGLDLCRGQTLEAELCRELRLDADAYLRMAGLKTAALFRAACESGAILGGGSQALVGALADFGENLGLAFQIHDDLLPYFSDTETMGKPRTSDVKNGRLTLPVILAHEAALPAEREFVRSALSGHGDAAENLTTLTALLQRTGALGAARRMARQYAELARRATEALPPSPSRDRLRHLADLAINRGN
jgi:geranylgeranyl diphosphate synthase, type I